MMAQGIALPLLAHRTLTRRLPAFIEQIRGGRGRCFTPVGAKGAFSAPEGLIDRFRGVALAIVTGENRIIAQFLGRWRGIHCWAEQFHRPGQKELDQVSIALFGHMGRGQGYNRAVQQWRADTPLDQRRVKTIFTPLLKKLVDAVGKVAPLRHYTRHQKPGLNETMTDKIFATDEILVNR